jgi:hypothetical protein
VTKSRDPTSIRPQPARAGPDYQPTRGCLSDALVRCVLPELPGPIWECAAGNGRLDTAMRAAGRTVIASDLFPAAADIQRHDFLHDPMPALACGSVIATNPPYNQCNAFIRAASSCSIAGRLPRWSWSHPATLAAGGLRYRRPDHNQLLRPSNAHSGAISYHRWCVATERIV